MTTFVVLGSIGLVLLVVSLVLGEFLDGVLDGVGGGWFSSATMGGFLAAFGFCAALADSAGVATPITVALGIGAGVAIGAFAGWLTRAVRNGSTDATPQTRDIIGYDGTVVSSIPADGFGVVTVRMGGHLVRLNARAADPIETGTAITVVDALSPTAVSVAVL